MAECHRLGQRQAWLALISFGLHGGCARRVSDRLRLLIDIKAIDGPMTQCSSVAGRDVRCYSLQEVQMRFRFGAIVIIILGIIFLLINLDIAPAAELKALLAQWWPLILIVVGVLALGRPYRHAR
jgi:uncharacterized integral membrane protein